MPDLDPAVWARLAQVIQQAAMNCRCQEPRCTLRDVAPCEVNDLRALLAALDAATQARDAAEQALQRIRDEYGQVCDEYEVCEHRSCAASYGAWATADEALTEAKHEQ